MKKKHDYANKFLKKYYEQIKFILFKNGLKLLCIETCQISIQIYIYSAQPYLDVIQGQSNEEVIA